MISSIKLFQSKVLYFELFHIITTISKHMTKTDDELLNKLKKTFTITLAISI